MVQSTLRRLGPLLCLGVMGCAAGSVAEPATELEVEGLALPLVTGCTQADTDKLLWAYWATGAMLQEALKFPTPSSDPTRWGRWFDVNYTQDQINEVNRVLRDINDVILPNSEAFCHHKSDTGGEPKDCLNPRTQAFVQPGKWEIHYCDAFFSANNSLPALVNTVVHEGAHLALPGVPDQSRYGDATSAMNIADWAPELAIKNAANYGHFVTNDPNLRY